MRELINLCYSAGIANNVDVHIGQNASKIVLSCESMYKAIDILNQLDGKQLDYVFVDYTSSGEEGPYMRLTWSK